MKYRVLLKWNIVDVDGKLKSKASTIIKCDDLVSAVTRFEHGDIFDSHHLTFLTSAEIVGIDDCVGNTFSIIR